jgi:hypothetical protein
LLGYDRQQRKRAQVGFESTAQRAAACRASYPRGKEKTLHRNMAMKTFLVRFSLALGAVCLLACSVLPAPAPCTAKLTFRRVFKDSSPEFIEITVREDSDLASYDIRQLDEEAAASPFQVGASLRTKMFELATQLNHFEAQDLDVHHKIAYLGEKTFRWNCGTEVHETKFNYTLNAAATKLLQIFEGLARQQEHADEISRRMKYDRLGVNDALLQFESDLNRSLLPEPKRLLPMLERIADDPKFVDIARQRARSLAARIRHQG